MSGMFFVFSAIVLEFRNQPMAVLRRAITRRACARGSEKRQIRRWFPQSNLNSTQILPPSLHLLGSPIPIHFVLFNSCIFSFFLYADAMATTEVSLSSNARKAAAVASRTFWLERVDPGREFFMKSNANTFAAPENFKQLLGSSHVYCSGAEEWRNETREFSLSSFNSTQRSLLSERIFCAVDKEE